MKPDLIGIHHVKLAVADLERSLKFFESCFGAVRIAEADHRHQSDGSLYAYILSIPGMEPMIELRVNPEQAKRNRLFDSITFAVGARANLEQWTHHLEELEIPHSGILTGVKGWVVVLEDPDENRLRLYTLESHGAELEADEDNSWLRGQ